METLEALQARIDTARDLKSVVRTMKSLAAASIRQYEHAVSSLRRYSETVRLGFQIALRDNPRPPPADDGDGPVGAIVIGSDHGLCGRFNEQIVRFAKSSLAEEEAPASNGGVLWLALGARVASRLEAEGEHLDANLIQPSTVSKLASTVYSLLLHIDEWQRTRQPRRLLVFHNSRLGSSTAAPRRVQVLPLDSAWLDGLATRRWQGRTRPMFTMDPAALFAALARQHLFVTLYRATAESLASEHASRLVAMQTAEKNIEEHLTETTAAYRRKRQEAITSELLEIVAGFEASSSRQG